MAGGRPGVGSIDSLAVIVGHDVPEHDALYLCHGHSLSESKHKCKKQGWNVILVFLF